MSTTKLHLITLPVDIIDRILTTLPDYHSLGAIVLSSKIIWKAFEAHRRGIVRHVAQNMYGGALPMALRLSRAQVHWPVVRHLSIVEIDSLEPEADVTEGTNIHGPEAKMLMENFLVSQDLAALFCQREKDRSAQENEMAGAEEIRFMRALHRCWLFSRIHELHPSPASPHLDPPTEDDAHALRKRFFLTIPNQELLEIQAFCSFYRDLFDLSVMMMFRDLSSNLGESNSARTVQAHMWISGPPLLVSLARRRYGSLASTHLPATYVTVADPGPPKLFGVLAEKYDERKLQRQNANPLVVSLVGVNDTCARCELQPVRNSLGLLCNLWNETNWSTLQNWYTSDLFFAKLGGRLAGNRFEATLFKCHLAEKLMRIENIFAEMFDLAASSPNVAASSGTSSNSAYEWSSDDWLCQTCVDTFLNTYLLKWWANERKGGSVTGVDINQERCWYGYECNTQRHWHHAQRLNHAEEPTRSGTRKVGETVPPMQRVVVPPNLVPNDSGDDDGDSETEEDDD